MLHLLPNYLSSWLRAIEKDSLIASIAWDDPIRLFLQLRACGYPVTRRELWWLHKAYHRLDGSAQKHVLDHLWKEMQKMPPVRRMPSVQEQEYWMSFAMQEAHRAAQLGEVPVGAVLIYQNQIISRAHNQNSMDMDPSAHAELLALRRAAETLNNHRLGGCDLYITLEPCVMCVGAIFQARISRVIYAAKDPKAGAAGSVCNLFSNSLLNHHADFCSGSLEQDSVDLLQSFFSTRRKSAQSVPKQDE